MEAGQNIVIHKHNETVHTAGYVHYRTLATPFYQLCMCVTRGAAKAHTYYPTQIEHTLIRARAANKHLQNFHQVWFLQYICAMTS